MKCNFLFLCTKGIRPDGTDEYSIMIFDYAIFLWILSDSSGSSWALFIIKKFAITFLNYITLVHER